MRRRWGWLVVAAGLLPSAWFAWSCRDFPHLGIHHDDGIYLGTARLLAEGMGYRIASLPGQPAQTRYPPVLPLYLVPAWRLGPAFPANLPLVMLQVWLLVPALGWLLMAWYRKAGFGGWQPPVMTALVLVSPYTVMLGVSVMTELLGCGLVFGALLAARSRHWWGIALAGGLAGCAFLTRTALLPLAPALAVALALEKRYRHALLVAALPALAFLGWNLWVRAHIEPQPSAAALFYTSYAGLYQQGVAGGLLPVVLWKNLTYMPVAAGGLFLFLPQNSVPTYYAAGLLALWAMVGAVRLFRRPECRAWVLFGVFTMGGLAVYNFPPHERLLYPVFPLLAAGLVREAARLAAILRQAFSRQKALAVAMGSVLLALLGSLPWSIVATLTTEFPSLMAQQRDRAAQRRPLFEWIRARTPPGATFLSYDDPLIWLYTGRQGYGMHPPTRSYYLNRLDEWIDFFGSAPDFARREGLDYLIATSYDFERDLEPDRQPRAIRRIREQHLPAAFQSEAITVYRVE